MYFTTFYFSDWVTDGLLKQIQKSEIIMKKMKTQLKTQITCILLHFIF